MKVDRPAGLSDSHFMLVASLALVLSAANVEPGAAVLVWRRTGVAPATAELLARQVSSALVAEHVPLALDADAARGATTRLGLSDASACDGRKRCLSELARQLDVGWVIALSFAQLGADRSMAVELFKPADGVVVVKDALILGDAPLTPEQLAPFAAKVRAALGVQLDAPLAPPPPPALTLEPPPSPPPVVVTTPALQKSPSAVSLGLGAGGVASLVVGAVLIITGVVDHADAVATQPSGSERLARYPADEVLRRANDADTRTGVGVALASLGLGLGSAAVLTW